MLVRVYRLHEKSYLCRVAPVRRATSLALSSIPIEGRPHGRQEVTNMPMLDAYIPEGALAQDAEERLLTKLTDLLIVNEGADPTNAQVRSIPWLFVPRPPDVNVAGSRAELPRYRFVASVPEGQYDAERRQAMVADITTAVLDAEDGAYDRDPARV